MTAEPTPSWLIHTGARTFIARARSVHQEMRRTLARQDDWRRPIELVACWDGLSSVGSVTRISATRIAGGRASLRVGRSPHDLRTLGLIGGVAVACSLGVIGVIKVTSLSPSAVTRSGGGVTSVMK